MSEELALKIDHVSKQYRLGQIGGGTLQGDIQSWWARVRGKEDPNSKIGSKQHGKNERFWALDDVNIEIKKGEAVGIIGHNGAGKSTLLKLLSRVTAPTKGEISVNGRIASMLEVGTGFHPEMTGRENIYMNGAILGMTKEEIDSKVEEIIDFSECRQFIDTPVKRYSSGMYVKLAFAVAAHLDSEILVMDEVLAVGDMKFQQKALGKMGDAAGQDGRTVLYVSHNMATIRQLCTRCIVLDHGRVIFDGDVEKAIEVYMQNSLQDECIIDLTQKNRPNIMFGKRLLISRVEFVGKERKQYAHLEAVRTRIQFSVYEMIPELRFRYELHYADESSIGIYESESIYDIAGEEQEIQFNFNIDMLPRGKYYFVIDAYEINEYRRHQTVDHPSAKISFEIIDDDSNGITWDHRYMGHVRLGELLREKL